MVFTFNNDLKGHDDCYKCDLMKIFPILLDCPNPLRISPSIFMREMKLTTQERCEKLLKPVRKVPGLVAKSQVFKISPDIVIFQNFTPGTLSSVFLNVINKKKYPVPLKIILEPSLSFSLHTTSGEVLSKIAPGLGQQVEIRFVADELKDYKHKITFMTVEETVNIDIIAITPRPLLDLPDRITLQKTPLNIQTERTIVVKNIGQSTAVFSIEITEPFTTKCNREILNPNDYFQLTVYFKPLTVGIINGNMKVKYETGEILDVILEGLCEEIAVSVDKDSISFENVYLGFSKEANITVTNDSEHFVDYKWVLHNCISCEEKYKRVIKEKFCELMEYELPRNNKLTYYDVAGDDDNQNVYKRILHEQTEFCNKNFRILFKDDHFTVAPIEGQLWPKTSLNFSIIFNPTCVSLHNQQVFLDIRGLKERIAIQMSGKCLGPEIEINLEEINAENIYIRSIHKYEVVFSNVGPVPGTVRYLPRRSDFGGTLTCPLNEFKLNPDENLSTYIEFSSLTRGKFVETIYFEIAESGKQLSFIIMGNIVCPLLNFDVTEIDFGDIAVGEVSTVSIFLENNTQVTIEYQTKIQGDGTIPAISLRNYANLANKVLPAVPFNEFSCKPISGEVPPYTKVPFEIQVTPSKTGNRNTELSIFMWEAKQTTRGIPLRYKAHVPTIATDTPKISIRSMFINQSYFRNITITNKTEFAGFLYLFFSVHPKNLLMLSLDKTELIVEPMEKYSLRLEIKSDVISDMSGIIRGQFYGFDESFLICEISVISRGPCIDTDLTDLTLGKLKTLQPMERLFTVSNDSPIPANVYFTIVGPFISVKDPYMFLQPEESKESVLRIYGTNTGKFKTFIKIDVDGVDSDTIKVIGEFVGGSITTVPRLDPEYNIGCICTQRVVSRQIVFINEGKMPLSISFKEFNTEVHPSGVEVTLSKPYFQLTPNQFSIPGVRQKVLCIECFSKSQCQVSTKFVCNAKKMTKKNDITSKVFDFKLLATFADPHLTFSKDFVEFRSDVGVKETIASMKDDIIFSNSSNMALDFEILIDDPFYGFDAETIFNKKSFTLDHGNELVLSMGFNPTPSGKKIQVYKGSLRVQYAFHPTIDKIPLIGVVNYPDIAFEPTLVDFSCIPAGHSAYKIVNMINISPLHVNFNFELDDKLFACNRIEFIRETPIVKEESSSVDSISEDIVLPEEDEDEDPIKIVNEIIEFLLNSVAVDEENLAPKEELKTIELINEDSSSLNIDYEDLAVSIITEEIKGKVLQEILLPIVYEFIESDDYDLYHDVYDLMKSSTPTDIRDIVDIVPSRGTLKPHECQNLYVYVKPPKYHEVSATFTCHIAGGAINTVNVVAKSGEIFYRLSGKTVDLGIVEFNKQAQGHFSVENTGYTAFSYMITSKETSDVFSAIPGWYNVTPSNGMIHEGVTFQFIVNYFPGNTGYFEQPFHLEIGHFAPVVIMIKGCAVMPQVCFEFPRPFEDTVNISSYSAIAEIVYQDHSNCNEDYTTELRPDYHDWVFLRYKRHYPSAKDIAMAVERQRAKEYLNNNNPYIAYKYANPNSVIPDLILPPYIVDLGYVVLNSECQIHLTASKYGPFNTKLFWPRLPRKCLEHGFSLIFQKTQPGPFLVFKPTAKNFPEPNTAVVSRITCLIVPTAKVEFEIRAVVTVPSISFQHSSIDFGKVQCGYCLRKTVFMENSGAVPCSWKSLIQAPSQRNLNIFFMKVKEGTINPGEYSKLDLYFQPAFYGKCEWKMIITIEDNNVPFKISLKGFGIMPQLLIQEEKLTFEPALPYSTNNVKNFRIENRSPFPVEICFTDFDSELDKEDSIVDAFLHYYNAKKLFIPPRKVGDSLPKEMIEFHENLIVKLCLLLQDKIKDEYERLQQLATFYEDQGEDGGESSSEVHSYESINVTEVLDPLEDKSNEEIQALLIENMDELKTVKSSEMAIGRRNSIYEIEAKNPSNHLSTEKRLKEGVVIIFHGALLTNYVKAANNTANKLNIPALSIDQVIEVALVQNSILAAAKVNQEIDESFLKIASFSDLKIPHPFDNFDVLEAKIKLILSATERKSHEFDEKVSKKKEKHERSSGASKESTTSKSKNTKSGNRSKISSGESTTKKGKSDNFESFLNLPLDILEELLTFGVSQYPTGLIIESLNNKFIKDPIQALTSLLKAIGHIRFIRFVYFSLPLENYLNMEEQKHEENFALTKEKVSIVNKILEMTPEEFENISPNDLRIYKSFYLCGRKNSTKNRLLNRETRMRNLEAGIVTKPKPNFHQLAAQSSSAHETIASLKIALSLKKIKTIGKDTNPKQPTGNKKNKKNVSKINEPKIEVPLALKGKSKEEVIQGFEKAEMEAWKISHILANWDRVNSQLLTPIPAKMPNPKSDLKKKDSKITTANKAKSMKSDKKSKVNDSQKDSKKTLKDSAKKSKKASTTAESIFNKLNPLGDEMKNKPKMIETKILTDEEICERKNIGIPLWYVNNAHFEGRSQWDVLISNYLKQSNELKAALDKAIISKKTGHHECEQLYTVLTEPKTQRNRNISNIFVMYDTIQHPPEMPIKDSFTLLAGKSSKSKISNGSSKKSLMPYKKKLKFPIAKSLVTRQIMQPDDVLNYQVFFFPTSCGEFSHQYNIEIVTYPMPFKVSMEGKADIPKMLMTPEVMFIKAHSGKFHDPFSNVGYFQTEDLFSFGPIEIQDENSRNECLIVEYKIGTKNSSFLPCEMSASFMEPTKDFSLASNNFSVLPNGSEFWTLRGHPTVEGKITSQLIMTIKNNPKVQIMKLHCLGCHLDVVISPRDVFFKRIIISRTVSITAELNNRGMIGVNWELKLTPSISNSFYIDCSSGYLRPLCKNYITFTYTAEKYEVIPIQELEIWYRDKSLKCSEPLKIDCIRLFAEVVDVAIEYETDVELGDIKIGTPVKLPYVFTNKSKYELNYNFAPLSTEKDTEEIAIIKQSTSMDPSKGPIKMNDKCTLLINFKCKLPMEFKSVPVFICIISDPLVNRKVATFQLSISGKVFSSNFKICPPDEVVFQHQLVDTEVNQEIIIRNSGKYSFTYAILGINNANPKSESKRGKKRDNSLISQQSTKSISSRKSQKSKNKTRSDQSPRSNKSDKPSSKSKTGKSSKPKIWDTTLKQGIFSLAPSTGVVMPHNEAFISISSKPKTVGDYEDSVSIFISGTIGKQQNGYILNLKAGACIPQVDLNNLEDIFKEHIIFDTMNEYLCSEQDNYSAFLVLTDKKFHFKTTCLNSESSIRIRIRNTGLIDANIFCQIANSTVFKVTPEKALVQPLHFTYFTITFKPTHLTKFVGTLKVSVEMSNDSLELHLDGEGCLPEVKIIDPVPNPSTDIVEMDYKFVILERKERKSFTLQNTGILNATVIVGVLDDPSISLSLVPERYYPELEAVYSPRTLSEEFTHTISYQLKPNETFKLNLVFQPKEEVPLKATVKIFIDNNPYEILKIMVKGIVFKEDIVISNLDSFVSSEQSNSFTETSASSLLVYKLDMGYCKINRLHNKYFKISNISDVDIYRFEFFELGNLHFVPSEGHLRPQTSKEIIATYYSNVPIAYEDASLMCKLFKIRYLNYQSEAINWDQRHSLAIWMPSSSHESSLQTDEEILIELLKNEGSIASNSTTVERLNTGNEEPQYEILDESDKILQMLFNITVDYCFYHFNDEDILIPNTQMFEKKQVTFTLSNPSKLPFEINWKLEMAQGYPIKSEENLAEEVATDLTLKTQLNRPKTGCCMNQPRPLRISETFVNVERPRSSHSIQFTFSKSYFSTAWNPTEVLPITITPMTCIVAPSEEKSFTITFSPHSPQQYHFIATSLIANLKPDFKQPKVSIFAKSILPLYHFTIEPSDYLSKRRGYRQVCDKEPLEGTKVLEFESLGLGIPKTSKFSIINPTGENFDYRWEKKQTTLKYALFQCETPEGSVLKGKSANVSFTFIAHKCGTFENFYNFFIEKYNLNVSFLLVGHAREPCVLFADNGIKMKPSIIGIDVNDETSLKNSESIELNFQVSKSTLYNEGRLQRIQIEPLKGSIPPKGEFPIRIKYHPTKVGTFDFNVEFKIERVAKPLVLTISTTCYEVEPIVKYVTENKISYNIEPFSDYTINLPLIAFGSTETFSWIISNIGKVGFYYKWETVEKYWETWIDFKFNSKEGYLKSDTSTETWCKIRPLKPLTKLAIHLLLKVLYGPSFNIILICSTCKMKLRFSSKSHDFGSCLVHKDPVLCYHWELEINNQDIYAYTVDLEPVNCDHLSIVKNDNAVLAKKSIKIHFYFHPRQSGHYKTDVKITVNDKVHTVSIVGEGVPLLLQLVNPKNSFIDIGPVLIGKSSKKKLEVINKSKCPVNVYCEIHSRLPVNCQHTTHLEAEFEKLEMKLSDVSLKEATGKKSKANNEKSKKKGNDLNKSKNSKSGKKSSSDKSKKSDGSHNTMGSKNDKKSTKTDKVPKKDRKKPQFELISESGESPEDYQKRLMIASIKVQPAKWLKLLPQQSVPLAVTFAPTERMPVFQEQIFCQIEDTVLPLSVVKASCIAPLFQVDKCKIAFGTVILGTQNVHYIKLMNIGDIGSKFQFAIKNKYDSFSIKPEEGYSSPNSSTTFEVTFRPSITHCLAKSTARLMIENFKIPFDIELTGTCIPLPQPKETLQFSGPVRQEYKDKITLKNTTAQTWTLFPSISGCEYFTATESVSVESKSSNIVEVFYNPLSMTSEGTPHKAKLFISLPEGQGLVYDLQGEATRPNIVKSIQTTIKSKTYHTIPLMVQNWLKTAQQFIVVNQITQPEDDKKVLYKLTGHPVVDLAALAQKEYKWIIYALNEGKLNFRVKFRNETTNEYIWYDISLVVTKADSLQVFELSTCARQTAQLKLKLENPLANETVYNISSPCQDLHFLDQVKLPPYTEYDLLVEYKPLLMVKEQHTNLEAVSSTLGTFPYRLILSASAAENEEAITIRSELGHKSSKNAYIYNFSEAQADFTAKFENGDFNLEKHLAIAPKEKGIVEISFEPSDLGGVHSYLNLTSTVLGEYRYPLFGIGIHPKPHGPYDVKRTSFTAIPFKNPFHTAQIFNYSTDSNQFTLKVNSEVIKARSSTKIMVGFAQNGGEDIEWTTVMGKLSVVSSNDEYKDIKWIMYLRGDDK